MNANDSARDFWIAAEPLLHDGAITRSSMMGLPSLRFSGKVIASAARESGDLVVRLPAHRVDALIESGEGVAFAPGGWPFREWVRIPSRSTERWRALMREAIAFVGSRGP